MSKRVLITYATKCGSTAEVAQAIGQVWCERGMSVDIKPVMEVESLDGYRAVIIGSAIRMGSWLPEAAKFVEKNQSALSNISVAYFLVSGYLRNDTAEMRNTVLTYLDPVRKFLEPKGIGMFAGKIDYSRLSFLDRTLAKSMKEPEGDWRNWEEIRGWAEELDSTLLKVQ